MKKLLKIQLLSVVLLSTTIFANTEGGIAPSLATTIEVNKEVTLLPTYESEYNGKPQKYAYYGFTVPNDTEATISYTAPKEGGSYLALYNSNNSQIITKWTAKETTAKVKALTLSTGDYYFLINKDGNQAQSIPLTVSLASNDNGGGDTKPPKNDNPPMTREVLMQHIQDWINNPNKENENTIVHANTSKIIDMSSLFDIRAPYSLNSYKTLMQLSKFNLDISRWDVSNVTNMSHMFSGSEFNQDISRWDVSNVTNMSGIFSYSRVQGTSFLNKFNQNISNWDVSNVTNMEYMFAGTLFNQPIENWKVSTVENMKGMFAGSRFNKPIGKWNVSNVTNMDEMFGTIAISMGTNPSSSFNQDISIWDISNVASHHDFTVPFIAMAYNKSALIDIHNPFKSAYEKLSQWYNNVMHVTKPEGSYLATSTFLATPMGTNIDTVIGFSNSEASAYSDLGIIVRFAPNGKIDVRDGNVYRANTSLSYKAHTTYTFRIEIDFHTKTYSVYVTPKYSRGYFGKIEKKDEILLADNYAFRTEKNGLTSVTNISHFSVKDAVVGIQTVVNMPLFIHYKN